MAVYWSACWLSMLFTWFGVHVKHRKTNTWYYIKLSFFSALPLIFIASIRYGVGQDYFYTYLPYFRRVQSGYVKTALEPLYHLLNVLIVKMGGNFPWIFAISAVIFFTIFYYQCFQDSPYIYLSIFLLVGTTYLFIFFNGMRQMIGCAILFLSLPFARERKPVCFFLIVAVASGFHWSCLLFAVFYFISNQTIKPEVALTATACIYLGGNFWGQLVNNLVRLTRYSGYVGSVFDTGQRGNIVLLINISVLVFASVFSSDNLKFRQYYNLQVIATWIAALSGKVVLISRIMWMFGLPCCILIPLTIMNIRAERKTKLNKLIAGAVVVVLYFAYTSYTIGVKNGNNVLPYQTIFSIRNFF